MPLNYNMYISKHLKKLAVQHHRCLAGFLRCIRGFQQLPILAISRDHLSSQLLSPQRDEAAAYML
jgi:hypothetical protein